MKRYICTVYDRHGVKLKETLTANSRQEAKALLEQKDLTPVLIKEAESAASRSLLSNKQLSAAERVSVTEELYLLIRSGLKIDRALRALSSASLPAAQSSFITKLYEDVSGGLSLSESIKSTGQFGNDYINMVKLGEESGRLPEVFGKLSEELKFRLELRRKLVQSLVYPSVILLVCISSILFVFNFVVPQMSGLFEEADNLPVYTSVLLGVSSWFQNYQLHLLLACVLLVVGGIYASKNAQYKRTMDSILFHTPLLKGYVSLMERISFNSSLSMLLYAGLNIDKALNLSIGSIRNRFVIAELQRAKKHFDDGSSLSKALSYTSLYPSTMLSIIEVGEESGNLSGVFEEISLRSRNQFKSWLETFVSLLEPVLIILMGGLVGSVVVVMLLSIVSVNDFGI